MLLICLRTARLVLGFFFLELASLDVFLKVASLYQILNLILQLGTLLCGMLNVFVIRTGVQSMSEWVRAAHEEFIGDGVQDLFLAGC